MPVSPPTRVNGNSARDLLAQRAEENATWVEELENGNALISYVEEANDEGEVLFIQYWIIANAAPPDLVRVALFSFTIPESKADDEETTKILEILHHELRQCTFGDYPVE
jgi:hypothetical protein